MTNFDSPKLPYCLPLHFKDFYGSLTDDQKTYLISELVDNHPHNVASFIEKLKESAKRDSELPDNDLFDWDA
ncbi:hypothetical protein kac65v151_gp073 [Nodularia phage vB_NspS-kac65v151]|jgi:hypothetical protein|uniref:Uncharacterized protein n=2 Tax=Ravarandavirus kac65v151 TaxID=2845689 RepID=A0A482MH92_9CAUD|nr:hypothetical protein HWC12_gp073 [Nodularia phage vB_NspS-kac65v151]QBQ73103.1 hypothetical protein kac65v151_gp073 [Nodularia phage vB_NspS-kac65v151]QBQ73311.1 hypothetical protein kac65v161_gp073 [Nodularia phage vB_NspS-kac65v161]